MLKVGQMVMFVSRGERHRIPDGAVGEISIAYGLHRIQERTPFGFVNGTVMGYGCTFPRCPLPARYTGFWICSPVNLVPLTPPDGDDCEVVETGKPSEVTT